MTASVMRRACARTARTLWSTRCFSIVRETVPLVFDLHEPPEPATDRRQSPIIFLHGLFGSKRNNRGMSKQLARDLGRYVYAVDLRNHGASPHHVRHDYTAMAEDVAAFVQEHALHQPTLIGHSMGAKTAMTLALDAPTTIADIVAVDNAPVAASIGSDFSRYIQVMKTIDAAGLSNQADADKILQPHENDVSIRQFLLSNLYRPAPGDVLRFRVPLDILARQLVHMGDFPFNDPALARFRGPALFVRGTRSAYLPDHVIPLVGQFFPLFELVDLDAGHWVISEKPEEFRQAVIKFLGPKD